MLKLGAFPVPNMLHTLVCPPKDDIIKRLPECFQGTTNDQHYLNFIRKLEVPHPTSAAQRHLPMTGT